MKKFYMFLFALCMVFTITSVQAQQEAVKYVPDQADFIMSVNAKQLLSSPEVLKSFEESLKQNPDKKKEFDKFKEQLGLDPLKDINYILIFSSLANEPAPNQTNIMAGALINGKFDVAKILKSAVDAPEINKEITVGKVDGFDALLPKQKNDGYGVFLNNTFLAVGPEKGMKAVTQTASKKGKSLIESKEFAAVLSKLNYNATVCAAGIVPDKVKLQLKSDNNYSSLAAVEYFYLDFTKADSISLNLFGQIDNDEHAAEVATLLGGWLSILKLSVGQYPEVLDMINGLKVDKQNNVVKVNLTISKAQIDKFKKSLEKAKAPKKAVEPKNERE